MSQLQTIARGDNYTAVSTNGLAGIRDFTFQHDVLPVDVEGKVFVSEALNMTGGILSLNTLPPKQSMPFHHRHMEHEEIYLIIQGQGEFMIDESRFEVSAGSVIRVAPQAVRCWRNVADAPLHYAVFQVKQGEAVNAGTIEDGRGVNKPIAW
ncbi:cupin domain-containing protein [Photobacterium aphoticum]|uniref:Cupin type-2 domain-containing protein n=1 Tax=Photobacterium aphoticum TaxID=754436 RepID=A0A0J1GHX8_9GAMM|nr:cupin domain-containing protein [Photobacterium aphoticum]KLU99314.1 hypothetical protein ABT58_17955 [Photobacterium aphoticum]PSU55780.1 cupin domain-containing protein [Photobacterium aphoticum]GHA59893.1 hypothetical protein GCM10007086_37210 [Photobacterium aphoticum]